MQWTSNDIYESMKTLLRLSSKKKQYNVYRLFVCMCVCGYVLK